MKIRTKEDVRRFPHDPLEFPGPFRELVFGADPSGKFRIYATITHDYKRLQILLLRKIMEPTEPITIRTSKDVVSQIDTLAAGMNRSRNYVVNQAIQQYLAPIITS
jgi:Ribbon-helix-helix protein, copG family